MVDAEIATSLGISSVYAWQIKTGKRASIESKAARKIETAVGKPEGWFDTDFDLWPFPGIDQERFAKLLPDEKIEIQGSVRKMMLDFESQRSGKLGEIAGGESAQRNRQKAA